MTTPDGQSIVFPRPQAAVVFSKELRCAQELDRSLSILQARDWTCDKLWSWRVSAGEMGCCHWRRESLGDYWGVKFMEREMDAIQKAKRRWAAYKNGIWKGKFDATYVAEREDLQISCRKTVGT